MFKVGDIIIHKDNKIHESRYHIVSLTDTFDVEVLDGAEQGRIVTNNHKGLLKDYKLATIDNWRDKIEP